MKLYKIIKELNIIKTIYYYKFRNKNIYIFKGTFLKVRNSNIKIHGKLQIGRSWNGISNSKTVFIAKENSKLVVKGNFTIRDGCNIGIETDALLSIGSGYISSNSQIHCFNRIEIGDDVVISENVTIRDSDNHDILYEGYQKSEPIIIGNHVWIGLNAIILKGVTIGSGSIVAAGSIVTKSIPPNSLVAGVPARVIKENIKWE